MAGHHTGPIELRDFAAAVDVVGGCGKLSARHGAFSFAECTVFRALEVLRTPSGLAVSLATVVRDI
jgi:hypothetical protein